MKKKNPFSQLLNHKLLHKIGKQWVVISATLLIFLSSGALMTHSVNASQLQPTQVQSQLITKPTRDQSLSQATAITQNAERMHQQLLRNHLKPTVNHQAHQMVKASQDRTAYHYERSSNRIHRRKVRSRRNRSKNYRHRSRQRTSRRRTKKTRRRSKRAIRHRFRKARRNRRSVKNRYAKRRFKSRKNRKHRTKRIKRNYRRKNRKSTLKRTQRRSTRRQLRRHRQRKASWRVRHHRIRKKARKNFRTFHHSRIKTASNYLIPDKDDSYYYLNSDGYNSLKDLSDENFGNLTSADDVSDPTPVTVEQKDNCHGYNFDQIKTSDNGTVWVPSDEVSASRHTNRNNWQAMNQMFSNLDQQYLQQNFSSDDINTINNLRSQYNYLLHNEDSSNDSDMANYRQQVIDCLNFYRNLEGLPSVTEDTDYDNRAQAAANSQHDLEDMNWGTSEPLEEINNYYTDANDLDKDGKAGHRSSILNPGAVYVGVGQNSDVNALFFNWGHDGSDNRIVKYPAQGPASYSDAVNGEYWSIHDPDFNGTPSDTITITVKDLTDDTGIKPIDLTFYNQDVYYRIPKYDIKDGHEYYIKMQDSNGAYVWYTTKLFSLSPNLDPQ